MLSAGWKVTSSHDKGVDVLVFRRHSAWTIQNILAIKVDFEWAIKLHRINLQLLGLWPKAKQIPREKLKCNLYVLVIFLMLAVGILIPCIQSLTKIGNDIILIIEHLQFILPIQTCIIRLVVFWWKKEAIIPVINMIAEDWLSMENAQEKKIMITWGQRARTIIMTGYGIFIVPYICLVGLPAFGISITYMANNISMGKMLPIPAYHIYDLTEGPLYQLAYISNAIVLFFAALTYTGIDNFLGLLVFHLCGQIDILKNRLCSDKLVNFRNNLKKCVIHHICLLRAIDLIEDAYNVILLVLFLHFGILFAFYGFLIVKTFEEKNDSMSNRLPFLLSNVLNIFLHMCLYCALGEILVAQCNKIYQALCNQEWYSLKPKNAKDLIFLMIESREPPNITAGKMFPMTMVTFCNLIKTSAGYISVLFTTRT